MCAARKDTLTGEPNRGGRPRTLKEEHVLALKEIVAEQPGATLEVVTQLLAERCGVKVCSLTVRRALQEAGVVRVKPTRRAVEGGPPAKPGRYGYTPAHRREAAGSGYGCGLTDAEWALVADLFEHRAGGRGMPPQLDRRTLVDACCYVLRTGCAWRLLPRSFPAWPTVYKSFSRWAAQGVFESMQDRLRQQWRERLGRHAQPSAAVLDSQSTRYSPQGGEAGFDAGKKVKGRKRHLVVDTLGLLLAVTVSAASVQDRDGAPAVVALACAKVPSLKVLFVDGAYSGSCAQALQAAHGLDVQVVRHPGNGNAHVFLDTNTAQTPPVVPKGFVPLPMRWVVERTHAWGERCRRLVMHHDRKITTSTAWVWFAQAQILLRRLALRG
jgi:transposase